MDISALVDRLASAREKVRVSARRALVRRGAAAVGPVLAALCDEDSPVDWTAGASVLREIGDPAFDPLVTAIAAATSDEVARRCGWAFSGLAGTDLERYVAALEHPHPRVRAAAAYVLQNRGGAALPYAPRLLPLLADPDQDVRQRAVWALAKIGPEVIPSLREVRRSKTAGRPRRTALTALVEIGGPAALDGTDLALVRRLIRVKMAAETPEPMHLCGSWYALPTGDQRAVLDAFDLGAAEPVTMRLGGSAWNRDQHDPSGDGAAGCARMYVTPVLDGWTLVFGTPHDPGDEPARAVRKRCAQLSHRFGAAHWYGMSCGDEWTAWCVAAHGEVVRYYDAFEPEDQVGPPHPAEEGLLLPHEDTFPGEAATSVRRERLPGERGLPDLCTATRVAARISVDPGALGPRTRVGGHGVLALGSRGRRDGHPPGALEV